MSLVRFRQGGENGLVPIPTAGQAETEQRAQDQAVGDHAVHNPHGKENVMTEPFMAQKSPYPVVVEAGQRYGWCACGRSKTQPFRDGSHKGSDFKPVEYQAQESGTLYLCGCKRTGNNPLCDGTHQTL